MRGSLTAPDARAGSRDDQSLGERQSLGTIGLTRHQAPPNPLTGRLHVIRDHRPRGSYDDLSHCSRSAARRFEPSRPAGPSAPLSGPRHSPQNSRNASPPRAAVLRPRSPIGVRLQSRGGDQVLYPCDRAGPGVRDVLVGNRVRLRASCECGDGFCKWGESVRSGAESPVPEPPRKPLEAGIHRRSGHPVRTRAARQSRRSRLCVRPRYGRCRP